MHSCSWALIEGVCLSVCFFRCRNAPYPFFLSLIYISSFLLSLMYVSPCFFSLSYLSLLHLSSISLPSSSLLSLSLPFALSPHRLLFVTLAFFCRTACSSNGTHVASTLTKCGKRDGGNYFTALLSGRCVHVHYCDIIFLHE